MSLAMKKRKPGLAHGAEGGDGGDGKKNKKEIKETTMNGGGAPAGASDDHGDGGVPATASFFKVADPETEGRRSKTSSLSLPWAFIERFHRYVSNTVELEAMDGRVFKAQVEVDARKKLRLTTGWRDLARHLGVESGDLLIFRLLAKARFQVLLFEGDDCCLKPPRPPPVLPDSSRTAALQNNGKGKGKVPLAPVAGGGDRGGGMSGEVLARKGKEAAAQLAERGKAVAQIAETGKSVVHLAERGTVVVSKTGKAVAPLAELGKEAAPLAASEKPAPVPTPVPPVRKAKLAAAAALAASLASTTATAGTLSASGGSNPDAKEPPLALPPPVGCGSPDDSQATAVSWATTSSGLSLDDFWKVCQQFRQRTQEAFRGALLFSSSRPSIIKVMGHSNVCHGFKLTIPRPFARMYMNNNGQQVHLLDNASKMWPVTWLGWQDPKCSTFSGGWKHFVMAHHLKFGDICVFELLQPTLFKVHMFVVDPADVDTIKYAVPKQLFQSISRDSQR